MVIDSYKKIIDGPLNEFLVLSLKIGDAVGLQAQLVVRAFNAQLQYLKLATEQPKPSQDVEVKLLRPTSVEIKGIQKLRERNRMSPYFFHLTAVSESIPALGWVCTSTKPEEYLKAMCNAGLFYINRVLKEWKEKSSIHTDWANSWIKILSDLQSYVRAHHPKGLNWGGSEQKEHQVKEAQSKKKKSSGSHHDSQPASKNTSEKEHASAPADIKTVVYTEVKNEEALNKQLKQMSTSKKTTKVSSPQKIVEPVKINDLIEPEPTAPKQDCIPTTSASSLSTDLKSDPSITSLEERKKKLLAEIQTLDKIAKQKKQEEESKLDIPDAPQVPAVPLTPMPPPPPPVSQLPVEDANGVRKTLLAEINQGDNIIKRLKKVMPNRNFLPKQTHYGRVLQTIHTGPNFSLDSSNSVSESSNLSVPRKDFTDLRSSLLSEINQGEWIIKRLRKVTPDMQTHNNPALRNSATIRVKPPMQSFSCTYKSSFSSVVTPVLKKPVLIDNGPKRSFGSIGGPVFKQDGKKWIVEHQNNNKSLVIEDAKMTNIIYMYKCEDCALTVKGKVNSIIIDTCQKCSLIFDSLVCSVDFLNCKSVRMQVLGNVPCISIDKTDGCAMYLSRSSLNVEIISSKSSEMNVLVPDQYGCYTEMLIPDQFRTVYTSDSLKTTCINCSNLS